MLSHIHLRTILLALLVLRGPCSVCVLAERGTEEGREEPVCAVLPTLIPARPRELARTTLSPAVGVFFAAAVGSAADDAECADG